MFNEKAREIYFSRDPEAIAFRSNRVLGMAMRNMIEVHQPPVPSFNVTDLAMIKARCKEARDRMVERIIRLHEFEMGSRMYPAKPRRRYRKPFRRVAESRIVSPYPPPKEYANPDYSQINEFMRIADELSAA